MILSYHLLPDIILVTHKLVPVTSLLWFVCCFWFVWFWFCVCLCFCLSGGFGVLVGLLRFASCDEYDSTQDYVTVLHQFTFEAIPPLAARTT